MPMRRTPVSTIIAIQRSVDQGLSLKAACKKHGITTTTYRRRAESLGPEVSYQQVTAMEPVPVPDALGGKVMVLIGSQDQIRQVLFGAKA